MRIAELVHSLYVTCLPATGLAHYVLTLRAHCSAMRKLLRAMAPKFDHIPLASGILCMHPAPHLQHHPLQVEVRNVRQKSGFEVDIFAASPNATVEYLDCVYYCFSCLPPPILVNLMYQLPKPPDEPNFPVG